VIDSDRSAAASPQAGDVNRPDRWTPSAGSDGTTGAMGTIPPPQSKARRNHKRSRSHRKHAGPLYAALDLGTNNCRLLIARPEARGFRVVDGFTRIVRLGEGLSRSGRLDDAAMERTLDALRLCREKIERHAPAGMRLIATEACRSASNAGEFLARVEDEVGLSLEIVDRHTEAQLAVTGCADLVESEAKGALLFDIGGGSSELAWLDFRGGRPRRRGKMSASIRSWQSLPIGVVTIAEKFGGVDVTPESFERMVDYVSDQLWHFRGRNKLKQMIDSDPVHLLGTSGTVTTLAGLHLGLDRYERSKVDGLWLSDEDITDTMRVLLKMPYDRRVLNPCIGRDRADLVIPGCAIFEAIRREWPAERVRVADRGLREGILISLIDADRPAPGGRRGNRGGGHRKNGRQG